jgi:predicted dehydrogenase
MASKTVRYGLSNMMPSEKKLKLGIIGTGAIAQIAHLPAAKKAANVELTSLCDVASDLGEAMARKYNVPNYYTNIDNILQSDDVDAVLIAVADQFHADLTIKALESGKHVLVEKPLSSTIEECKKVVEAARRTGRKVQIGCMKRYDPGLQFAKKFIDEKIGVGFGSHFWYCDSVFHMEYVHTYAGNIAYSKLSKRPPKRYEDNDLALILGHGVHLIDTIRWLKGNISAVNVKSSRSGSNVSFQALLEYSDGTTGTMQLTCIIKMDWFEGFHIHGENGSVIARVFFPYMKRVAEVVAYDSQLREYRLPTACDTDPYERQLEAFAEAVLNDKPVMPDCVDGLLDEVVLYAIYESMKKGSRVVVEEVGKC